MLRHSDNQLIIEQLVDALKLDDPNRSTNAAFAIGRLIESDDGKNLLISVCGIEKLVSRFESSMNFFSVSFNVMIILVRCFGFDARSQRRERRQQKCLLCSQLSLHNSVWLSSLFTVVDNILSNSQGDRANTSF